MDPAPQAAAADVHIPVGWRFDPTEDELVRILSNNAALTSLPPGIITEVDAAHFFGSHPRNLGFAPEMYQEPVRGYFLVNDETCFLEKQEHCRVVHGKGCWRHVGEKEQISDENGILRAYKIYSSFYKRDGRRTKWRMKEVWLSDDNVGSNFEPEVPKVQRVMARIIRGKNIM